MLIDRVLWLLREDADELRLSQFCDDGKGYKLAARYATAILDLLTEFANWEHPAAEAAERVALDSIVGIQIETDDIIASDTAETSNHTASALLVDVLDSLPVCDYACGRCRAHNWNIYPCPVDTARAYMQDK